MKKFRTLVSALCALALLLSLPAPALAEESAAPSPWAAEAVERAVALGMVPEKLQNDWQNDLTRGEFAQLVVSFLAVQYGYGPGTGFSAETFVEDYLDRRPGPDGKPFSKADYLTEEEAASESLFVSWQYLLTHRVHVFEDVDDPYGVGDDINMAYLLGIVKGRDATHYDPDGPITRQEAATLLSRAYGTYGTLEPQGEAVPFVDSSEIAPWAAENVDIMQSWDILHGDENGAFLPTAHYTREQGVIAFLRLYEKMPVSRSNGALAPLLTQEEVVERCLTSGPLGGSYTQYRADTETCTILYLTFGGVMHPPEPAIFLIYPDSTFKRVEGVPSDPTDFQLNEAETVLTFTAAYLGDSYRLDLKTGALSKNVEETTLAEEDMTVIAGFYHRPFEELPQELRDSLEWDGQVRTEQGYNFRLRDYTGPGIVITTTEAKDEALKAWLDWQLGLPEDDEAREGADEELRAEYEQEKGREWLYAVTITDDSYATVLGLKVGNTVDEAEALGYPLRQRLNDNGEATFGDTWEHNLRVRVEDDVVKELYLTWGIGRYTGKYWDL